MWSFIAIGLLLTGAAGLIDDAAPYVQLRAASPFLRLIIEETTARSPTVRALIARLACTDVIVYVEMTASPQVPLARTKLVTARTGVRFLRIGINAATPAAEFGPLLAHELQHAVEIAEHDEVRDDDGVRRLYARIGRDRGGDRFETQTAGEIEFAVREELRHRIGG